MMPIPSRTCPKATVNRAARRCLAAYLPRSSSRGAVTPCRLTLHNGLLHPTPLALAPLPATHARSITPQRQRVPERRAAISYRWVMSKPIAVPARPGLSRTPMLASADDAVRSHPVLRHPARCEGSWSQSRSQGPNSGHRRGLTADLPLSTDPDATEGPCRTPYFSATVVLRFPPVKRWVRRDRSAYLFLVPLFALCVLSFTYVINELVFKGVDAFTLHPTSD